MTVKRYVPVDQWGQELPKCMVEDEVGPYVLASDYDALRAERDALQEENAVLYCRLLKLDIKWAELMAACKVNHDLADHVYDVFKEAVWEKKSNDL